MNTKSNFPGACGWGFPSPWGIWRCLSPWGITAKNAGLSAFQATLTSLLVNALGRAVRRLYHDGGPRGLLGDRHF